MSPCAATCSAQLCEYGEIGVNAVWRLNVESALSALIHTHRQGLSSADMCYNVTPRYMIYTLPVKSILFVKEPKCMTNFMDNDSNLKDV